MSYLVRNQGHVKRKSLSDGHVYVNIQCIQLAYLVNQRLPSATRQDHLFLLILQDLAYPHSLENLFSFKFSKGPESAFIVSIR